MNGETEILAGGDAEAKRQGIAHHVECGGSPPPLAAGGLPRRAATASHLRGK